ncbi:MAG TPA: GTP-binding protein [Syntrophomonadaceae bacterium]|nr:GTP-binding protein [Syntrophomonadaceae bacterium]
MKVVIITGTSASGKTSLMYHVIKALKKEEIKTAVCKIDCLNTTDDEKYAELGVPVALGLSDYICPDHYYVSNLEEIFNWAAELKSQVLVIETAGLCNRCAPAVEGCLNICVLDNLSGLDMPSKVGPLLTTADIAVITKGDIVSQAEREVFRYRLSKVNPQAQTLNANGLTGQGASKIKEIIMTWPDIEVMEGRTLKASMPSAVCSYCTGEQLIGSQYQMGNIRKEINWGNNHD